MNGAIEGILSDPHKSLALSLSTPASLAQDVRKKHVQVEVFDETVVFSVPRGVTAPSPAGHFLGSKETIAFAILLYETWKESFVGKEDQLLSRIHRIADQIAHYHQQTRRELLQEQLNPTENVRKRNIDIFIGILQPPIGKEILRIDEATNKVLDELENEGLVVDPGITATGLVVLVGLIPVRWSVRTPKGEDVYREIKVQAGLWSLEIQKKRRGSEEWKDWEFRIRGINLVKRLLGVLAREYLSFEHNSRDSEGNSSPTPPTSIELLGDESPKS